MTCSKHDPVSTDTAIGCGELCPLCMLDHIKRLETALVVIKNMPAGCSWRETAFHMRSAARLALKPDPVQHLGQTGKER